MHKDAKCIKQLSSCGLGLACSITWGLALFILVLFNLHFDWGGTLLDVLSSLYIGIDYNIKGAFIGLFWGLAHGFIAGWVTAFLYNCSVHHIANKCCKSSSAAASSSCCGNSNNGCCG